MRILWRNTLLESANPMTNVIIMQASLNVLFEKPVTLKLQSTCKKEKLLRKGNFSFKKIVSSQFKALTC